MSNEEWKSAGIQTNIKPEQNKKDNAGFFAILSLVIGLVSLIFSCMVIGALGGIIGIIFAVKASKQNPKVSMATTGMVLSIFAVVIGTFVLFGSVFFSDKDDSESRDNIQAENIIEKDSKQNENKESTEESNIAPAEESTQEPMKEWETEYQDSDIQFVSLKYLSKNAKYYKGCAVLSVSQIYEVGDGDLQFDTDESNFFKEVTCKFKNSQEISGFNKKDQVCFIGEVSSIDTYFGNDTVTIKNCYIVAKGKDVANYKKKIEKKKKQQEKYVSNAKKKKKQEKNKAAKKKMSSYIKKCRSYSYEQIQRHPDKFKGKNIKLSGKVVQVMDGWFDSVAFRIEDSSGKIWYVNYSYSDKEAKILENDNITVYGESAGTETYTTVLGSSQTIPSIDAQYIVR